MARLAQPGLDRRDAEALIGPGAQQRILVRRPVAERASAPHGADPQHLRAVFEPARGPPGGFFQRRQGGLAGAIRAPNRGVDEL